MRPTVVTGLSDNTRCMQEEIFGQCISVNCLSYVLAINAKCSFGKHRNKPYAFSHSKYP